MAKKPNITLHECTCCGENYRKQDFSICPHCGGDGGGIVTKTWRPNKHQKKEFRKKMNNQNLS